MLYLVTDKFHNKENNMDSNKILLIVLAIILPPLAVFLKNGNKINGEFWLNIVLCILGGVPGVLHALYVVLK